ncbi:MAG: type III-B CRISPR module RAMP protein Cmr6 [Gracilibacteraceae bacterium]|jgi:CRISPR-associated protein Cmr6|nr:type III-B CRISPR module RAMP protein Cmr6 [Gracilibacteraceae bacterium]
MKGKIVCVKLRDDRSGYGFIRCADFKYDLWFAMPSGKAAALTVGAEVEFLPEPSRKKPDKKQAKNVHLAGGPVNAAYYLPQDTAELLFGSSGVVIDNTALKTQKYIRIFREKEKKLKILSGQTYTKPESRLLSDIVKSQLDILAAYKSDHCVTAALGSRMAVGLGSGSVFETGITLHHTYGFPYIPGSALKGCLRSFVILGLFDGSEESALADGDFIKTFGAQGNAGQIIFLDAYPAPCSQQELKLQLDIMNPHYGDYYKGQSAPTDDQSPNPIKFYAVPKDTPFTFRLVSRELEIKKHAIRGESVPELFAETLGEMGVGAKTAVGYGWFGNIKEVQV